MTCPFQMHLLQIRDHLVRHLDDLDHLDVQVLHQLMDLNCDMDPMHLVHLHLQDVQQNLDVLDHRHLLDVVHLDVQRILVVVRLVVVHLDVLHPLVVVVDVELRHRLRKDYFLDEEDVELPLQSRMDCYQDEALLAHLVLVVLQKALMARRQVQRMQLLQLMLLALPHVMPSTLQDQHRALLQVLLRVLD